MNNSKLSYFIVDVFGCSRYSGNQLAVFQNCNSLTSDEMQKIAREVNFSETTFILSNDLKNGGYDVRIFTPLEELGFAGHPTLGTAWVIKNLIEKSDKSEIKLNLKVGQVPVNFIQNMEVEIGWMKQVQPKFGKTFSKESISDIINLPPIYIDYQFPIQEVSTGLPAIIVPLTGLLALEKVSINVEKYFGFIKNTWAKTIYLFSKGSFSGEDDFSVRFFPINLGISEDLATGSAAGCLTAYLLKNNYLNNDSLDLKIEQGVKMKRISNLFIKGHLEHDKYQIEVGGKVFPVASGVWL